MGLIRVRNKTTGEITDVESESQEWEDMLEEVTPAGQPKWEQTGAHHAKAVRERAENGSLRKEDLGEDDQEDFNLAEVDPEDLRPDPAPHESLTPAEREAGIESYEQKLEQHADERDRDGKTRVLRRASRRHKPRRRRGQSGRTDGGNGNGSDESNDVDLDSLSRDELELRASEAGIENPDDRERFPNKGVLADSIREAAQGGGE